MSYLVTGEPGPARAEGAIRPDPRLPRACVIGGGSAGIAAARALYEARVPFDCFERGPVLGGMWVFENPNGLSGAYSTLEMNTSRARMAFADFPMPGDPADYPMHWEVREYFEAYVDHFGFREAVTLETEVERVEPVRGGGWEVTIAGGGAEGGRETRRYAAVLVANGHHWDPRWPEPPFPGSFDGERIHAHDYRDPSQLEGRRVIVLGVGNSGVDIASAAARSAEAAFVSSRRGVHVLRKRLWGRPIDQVLLPPWVPWPLKQKGIELLRVLSGSAHRHGLPRPDHRVGHAHPTVSDEFVDWLADGSLIAKPNIRELRGDRVEFEDGSVERADLIVYATGYRVTFPFFDRGLISAPDNDLPLFRRTFHPDYPGLYFVGLAQPLGALMPIHDVQGRWIADHLTGRYALPRHPEIAERMERERRAHARRFYRSARHTMEIDFDEWLRGTERERRRGERRALRRDPGGSADGADPDRAAGEEPGPSEAARELVAAGGRTRWR